MATDVFQQAVRIAWARDAERAGLTPAAAFWRWKALMERHVVFWLRRPVEIK